MSDVEHIQHVPSDEECSSENGLTGIPHRIHWPATQDSGGSELDELDVIVIENLLDTLADIAIRAASRQSAEHEARDEYTYAGCSLHTGQ